MDAWRDLWYHTGDRGSLDAEGYLRFAGRTKDVIRRRGRNIGAEEIEQVAAKLFGVIDAAAIAVPSELTEDDIKLVIQTSEPMEAEDLLAKLVDGLPRYMVPRYIEILGEMPRTPTGKVDKNALRKEWATPGTWDSERSQELVHETSIPIEPEQGNTPQWRWPASGLRVLDTSSLAPGNYATLILARLGAEVIKLERPSGDPIRGMRSGQADPFVALNAGKKSVVVDLKEPEGQRAFDRLIALSDVIVELYLPDTARRLGVTFRAY